MNSYRARRNFVNVLHTRIGPNELNDGCLPAPKCLLLVHVCFSVIITISSAGAAGVPSIGMVPLMMVLSACSLPLDDIGLLLSVDWLMQVSIV